MSLEQIVGQRPNYKRIYVKIGTGPAEYRQLIDGTTETDNLIKVREEAPGAKVQTMRVTEIKKVGTQTLHYLERW